MNANEFQRHSRGKKNVEKRFQRYTKAFVSNKTRQAVVRLTAEQSAALERIAEETGQDVAKLLRYGAEALIKHYHRCGDRLVLPIDFSEVVQTIKAGADERVSKLNAKSKAA